MRMPLGIAFLVGGRGDLKVEGFNIIDPTSNYIYMLLIAGYKVQIA